MKYQVKILNFEFEFKPDGGVALDVADGGAVLDVADGGVALDVAGGGAVLDVADGGVVLDADVADELRFVGSFWPF